MKNAPWDEVESDDYIFDGYDDMLNFKNQKSNMNVRKTTKKSAKAPVKTRKTNATNGQPLKFVYTTATGKSEIRTIIPDGKLVPAKGTYLMRGMDLERKSIRSFRCDRIKAYIS